MGHLVDAPGQLYAPPPLILEGLRRVRPCADLLWDPGKQVWLLGEVRWNSQREVAAIRAIRHHWQYVKRQGARALNPHLLWEHDLARQGWSWIRDYRMGALTWRVVEDYARMCHKEDFGILDAEFLAQLNESDGGPFERKVAGARDYARYQAREAYRYAMLGRRSVGPSPTARLH